MFEAVWQRLTLAQRATLRAVVLAEGRELLSADLRARYRLGGASTVQAALQALRQDYDRPGGLQLVEVAGGYQIVTRPDLHEWVRRLFHERSTQKLTVQSLETLAVIAYKQPITARSRSGCSRCSC